MNNTKPFDLYREFEEINIKLTKKDINKLTKLAYKNNRSHLIRFTSGMLFSDFLDIYNIISSGRLLRDYDKESGLKLREEMKRISLAYIRKTCQYICKISSGEVYHLNGRMLKIANDGEFGMNVMYFSENIITDKELDDKGYYYQEKFPSGTTSRICSLDYEFETNYETIYVLYDYHHRKYILTFEHNFVAVFKHIKTDNTRFNIKNLPEYFEE